MRLMSFFIMLDQMLAGTKPVTRRLNWLKLKAGDIIQPVRKGMGLRPGEKIEHLGRPIIVDNVRREPLNAMTQHTDYGFEECILEGFGEHPTLRWPSEFVSMFCNSHKGCQPHTIITRIEFVRGPDGKLLRYPEITE